MRTSHSKVTRRTVAALILLAAALLAPPPAPPRAQAGASLSAEELFARGLSRAAANDYTGALADFTEVIRLDPRNAEAFYQRGLLLRYAPWENVGLPSTSLKDLARAIELNPRHAAAQLQYAIETGSTREFDRAIALNPESAEAFYLRGRSRVSDTVFDYLEYFNRTGMFGDMQAYEGGRFKPEEAHAHMLGLVRASVEDYAQAIRLKPDYVEAHFAKGLAHEALKEYGAALQAFERAAELDPRRVDALRKAGLMDEKLGDYRAAAAAYTRLIAVSREDAGAYHSRAVARLNAGDVGGAAEDYVAAMRLGLWPDDKDAERIQGMAGDPRLARTHYELGLMYRFDSTTSRSENKGKGQNAVSHFTRAIELDPSHAGPYYQRGLYYLKWARLPQAIADFTHAVALAPDNADAYFARGEASFQAKDYSGAIADYTEAIRRAPELTSVFPRRGFALSALGRWAEAIADFDEAIRLDDHWLEAFYGRGLAYEASGDSAKAVADFVKVAELSTDSDDRSFVSFEESGGEAARLYYRGLARFQLGRRDEEMSSEEEDEDEGDDTDERGTDDADEGNSYFAQALEDFSRVVALRPRSAAALYQRARTRQALQDGGDASAAADLDAAIRLNPSLAQARLERALLRKGAEARAAVRDLSEAIRLKPDWAWAYYLRAHLYAQLDGVPYAPRVLADYARVVKLEPDFAQVYSELATALRGGKEAEGIQPAPAGRLREAEAALTQLIRLEPEDYEAYRRRGEVRFELKDYRGAVADFTRSVELHGMDYSGLSMDEQEMFRRRGLARFYLGDWRGSYEDYLRAEEGVGLCAPCSVSSSVAAVSKADAFYSKGLKLSLRGDKPGAKANFEEAARLYRTSGNMPKYQEVRSHLAGL